MSDEIEITESKSAQKREAHRLRAIGVRLAALNPEQLDQIPVADELRRVLSEHARITSHIARRRHTQLIGRLMRRVDVAEIEVALAALEGKSANARYTHHSLEQWRSRLIDDDGALTEFVSAYPHTDVQKVRLLVRRVRSRPEETAYTRALFRLLRDIVDDHPVPPTVI